MQREDSDFSFTLGSQVNYVDGFGVKTAFGLEAEAMVSNYFGLQGSVMGNKDYVSFNGPLLLIPLGILISDSDGSSKDIIQLIEIIFWASAIENPALHIPINDRFEITTYLSLCRIRYWWNAEQPFASSWLASGSVGIKGSYSFASNWYLSLSTEYNQLYYSGRPKGFQIGLSIGRLKKSR